MLVYLAKGAEELAPLYGGEATESPPTPGPVQTVPSDDGKTKTADAADKDKAAWQLRSKRHSARTTWSGSRHLEQDLPDGAGDKRRDLGPHRHDQGHGHRLESARPEDSGSPRFYRSRQRLAYPDGKSLEDVGRATFRLRHLSKVKGVTPGKRLLIVRRMDYVYGDYSLEFEVDGKKAGICECPGTDRINRWRNWPHIIPAEFVVRAEPNVKQIAVTAGRDISMFRYWFHQPRQ